MPVSVTRTVKRSLPSLYLRQISLLINLFVNKSNNITTSINAIN